MPVFFAKLPEDQMPDLLTAQPVAECLHLSPRSVYRRTEEAISTAPMASA